MRTHYTRIIRAALDTTLREGEKESGTIQSILFYYQLLKNQEAIT